MSPICPICSGRGTSVFLQRDRVPIHQNLLVPEREQARQVPRGDLHMAACDACGFVFNQAFDPSLLAYGTAYDNTQCCSPTFDDYMCGLARHLLDDENVRGRRIVEVGCGKADFLRLLVEPSDANNTGYGFDPSYVGPDSDLGGRLRFERRYYDASCSDVPADVVVCRHVIEHVADPVGMLRSIRMALSNADTPRVYFETPCVEWILEHQVVWDFFYEHCSLFTATSLRTAFEVAGLSVRRVVHVFGGQYLWLEAELGTNAPTVSTQPGRIAALAAEFGRAEQTGREQWREQIETLRAEGKVALWGAGAKGTTLATLVDPDCELIDCVVDINPNKQGHFVPGTGHPIVAPSDLGALGVANAILMNPNYRDENLALLRQAGISTTLIG